MITSTELLITKSDIILSASIIVILNIYQYNFSYNPNVVFNETVNFSLATLLGFILHGLITIKISTQINKQISKQLNERQNHDNRALKQSIYDLIRFSTVFITQHLISSYLSRKPLNFADTTWIEESGIVISGFIGYNYLKKYLFRINGKYKFLINDLIKISFGYLLAYLVMDGKIKYNRFISYLGIMTAIFVYHLIASSYGYSQDNFGLLADNEKLL